jgi:hypothetical protein
VRSDRCALQLCLTHAIVLGHGHGSIVAACRMTTRSSNSTAQSMGAASIDALRTAGEENLEVKVFEALCAWGAIGTGTFNVSVVR